MNTSFTFAQAVWPALTVRQDRVAWLGRRLILCVAFSGLVALCAHAAFPLPGNPVPITMQTFGVLLTGALLGPRLGAAAILLYVIEGLCGLPVFAPTARATAGLALFALPTFGYLAGFVAAAFAAGWFAERGWDRKPLTTLAMMLLSSTIIFLFGALWLTHFVGSFSKAVLLGVVPFLPGDALKAALAMGLLPAGWRLIGARKFERVP